MENTTVAFYSCKTIDYSPLRLTQRSRPNDARVNNLTCRIDEKKLYLTSL